MGDSVLRRTPLSKPSIQDCWLYVIIDRDALRGRDPLEVAEAALRGGADLVQWRDKKATDPRFLEVADALRDLTRRMKSILVVNDRVDAACRVGADGVHVGQGDLSIAQVRRQVGDSMFIGCSTHSLDQAREAEGAGADYIGVGPVFATPTKPDAQPVGLQLIERIHRVIRIPWFAIGGIDFDKIPEVLSAGASRVAVVRAVAGADDPSAAARALKKQMSSFQHSIVR